MRLRVAGLLLIVIALGACGGGAGRPPTAAPSTPGAPDPADVTAHPWRLVAVADTAVAAVPPRTLSIGADGSIDGSTGCNGFGGSAQVGPGTIAVGPLVSTKRACVEPDAQALEGRYLTALGTARAWAIGEGGELVIEGPDGRLTFVAGP